MVEPVFGQIREARGIRRFLLRGLGKVSAEWKLLCATHNLPNFKAPDGAPSPPEDKFRPDQLTFRAALPKGNA
ncbi:MAG: hypothetical protein EPN47_17950 [Acidobacteria bacterium]|nr:MAG: hypothetical protein EPN47_17950 [Acidobacteriota bacterium]